MIRTVLEKKIREVLKSLGIAEPKVLLEHPADMAHGDYATNVALVYAKELRMKPVDLAQKVLVGLREGAMPEVTKTEIAGPGFINFSLSESYLKQVVKDSIDRAGHYGQSTLGAGRKVLVEYSSPNIAKPFTIGHLRSTIIGDAIANILAALGYEVIRDNHLGDWGTQFGKQIVALEKWGSIEALRASAEPMKYLVDLYVKFHDEAEKDAKLEDVARARFVDLEKGEPKARAIYEATIECSKAYFNSIYDTLGVSRFDTELGESFFSPYIPDIVAVLRSRNLLQKSDGAELVFFPEEKYPPFMVVKSDGSTIYGSRDLATDKYRLDTYGPDLIIVNEVGVEQTLHFRQLIETEKMLGWVKDGQRKHVAHGLYRFKDGKMSTRKGNVIWLEEILKEAVSRAEVLNKDSARAVGIGAVKFNDLKRDAGQDIIFDWDEMMTLKGDSGPYVQYTAVRAGALLGKATVAGIAPAVTAEPLGAGEKVARLIARYPDIVERAGREYAPHQIALFALELAGAFNSFYGVEKIVDERDSASAQKVLLAVSVRQVLMNALGLLGITVPARM